MSESPNDQNISVVVPLFNEAKGLVEFHESLIKQLNLCVNDSYELIYCDDGSTDNTSEIIKHLIKNNNRVKLLRLTRNFGKENTLTAGISLASGQAIITMDGDGQHPVELLPKFVNRWKHGSRVIIGVRNNYQNDTFKKLGSKLFFKLSNILSANELMPGSTDYRLIDRSVQQAFVSLKETNRITRGLIDWLGFEPEYIIYDEKPRIAGTAGYTSKQLVSLAANSFVSLSPKPLYIFGYLGIIITTCFFLLGITVFIEQLLLGDPLHWKFTGTAMLGILILFVAGIILMSQGILSLYISHIHSQSKGRPLYVVDTKHSIGLDTNP